MYYEERIIGGELCCRTSPDDYWRPVHPSRAAELYTDLSHLKADLEEAVGALRPFAKLADESDKFRHEAGSTCMYRVRYDDTAAARAILAKHSKKVENS